MLNPDFSGVIRKSVASGWVISHKTSQFTVTWQPVELDTTFLTNISNSEFTISTTTKENLKQKYKGCFGFGDSAHLHQLPALLPDCVGQVGELLCQGQGHPWKTRDDQPHRQCRQDHPWFNSIIFVVSALILYFIIRTILKLSQHSIG